MDPLLIGFIGVLALIVLLILGVHIGFAMGLIGFLGIAAIAGLGTSFSAITTGAFHFATSRDFVVLPLFILMGLLAMNGGISEASFVSLYRLAGRLPGSLGVATVAACTAFGTVCGSSIVTATVFAKAAAPEMRKKGYNKRLAYGIVSSSGMIGMLIPPSMLAVIYALLTEESIGALLMAGVMPGLLLAFMFSAYIVLLVKLKPEVAPSAYERLTWRKSLSVLNGLWPIAIVAFIVIGGIYGGIFTPSEAGAWGAFVILIVALTWGKMRGKQLWNALGETVGIMAMVFLIMIAAMIFARFVVISGLGPKLVNTIVGMDLNVIQLLIGMMILYLILGCFIGSTEMLCITLPIIYPIIKAMDINTIWFAMIVIMSVEIGLITPPVGMNVFVVKSVAEADISLHDIFIGVFPFVIIAAVAVLLVILFPAIATWLPSTIFSY